MLAHSPATSRGGSGVAIPGLPPCPRGLVWAESHLEDEGFRHLPEWARSNSTWDVFSGTLRHVLRRYLDFLDARDSIPSDLLWHYTNVGGVKGILDSSSLWSTDAQFLNDDAELVAGIPIVTNYLRSGAASLPADDDRQRLISSIVKMLQDQTRIGGFSQNFMCSLSAVGDSLSQYRAYGNYALGFDQTLLSQAAPKFADGTPGPGSPDVLAPVLYINPVRPSARSSDLEQYLRAALGGYVTDEDRVQPALQWHSRHDSILKVLSLLKHEAFSAEEEWRLRWAPFYGVGDREPLVGDYTPRCTTGKRVGA